MKNKYISIIKKQETPLIKANKLSDTIGTIKLLLFGLLLGFIILSAVVSLWFLSMLAISFVLLVFFSVRHNKLKTIAEYHQGIIDLCNRQLERIDGKWTGFIDNGKEFVDNNHAYSSDLDIVGDKSLFQMLNTSKTWHGRMAFANDLLQPNYDCAELKLRQQAIKELSKECEYATKVQYYASKVKLDKNAEKLAEELSDNRQFILGKALRLFLLWFPFFTLLVGVVLLFWQPFTHFYFIILAMFFLQIVIAYIGANKTKAYFGFINRLSYKFSAYAEIIDSIIDINPQSEKLKSIKQGLVDASLAMNNLAKISDMINMKLNEVFNILANALLWWDFRCAIHLQKWKSSYAHQIKDWFLTIGEFESLLSFSNLPNICSNVCLPEIKENKDILSGENAGHPLLLNDKRVNNDFELDDNILIISGSNMSGKTTFLRTVGINLVLAYSGGFVCAKRFLCHIRPIMTSMRIADDLNEGISTFYAELKRISRIIDFAKTKPQMLFLIDEIFRGTNSVDRLTGAKTVINKLNNLNTIGIISTHDLELCQLAKEQSRIKNYNFSESYHNNEIHFDYKLKQGVSTTTNAKHLMKMVGIIEE